MKSEPKHTHVFPIFDFKNFTGLTTVSRYPTLQQCINIANRFVMYVVILCSPHAHHFVRVKSHTLTILNTHMWTMLSLRNTSSSIHFVSGQPPAIFDAIPVLAYGYASGTGLAIGGALRRRLASGGCARPRRPHGRLEQLHLHGNCTWVEVWTSEERTRILYY